MIKLIIFDLDGVLADTEHIHYHALCDSINSITGLLLPEIKNVIKTDGSTTKSKLSVLKQIYNWDNTILYAIDNRKQKIVVEQLKYTQSTFEQIEMLSALALNYKLAIGSNARKHSVDTIVDSMNIRYYFQYIIAIEDVGIPKPDPAIYNYIMKLMNITPSETLIIEDSVKGIEAARASNAHVLVTTSVKETTLEFIQNAINQF